MPVRVNVAGLVTVKYGGDIMGYTRNGVDITMEAFFLDVAGDEFGGDDGPPVDVQYLGEVGRVRCEFTKYDITEVNNIFARKAGAAAGVVVNTPTNTLLRDDPGLTKNLILTCAVGVYTFPYAIPRAPIELNKGTKFSTLVAEFECHAWAGTLYTLT